MMADKLKLESCPGCGSYEIMKDHYHCSYCGNNFQKQANPMWVCTSGAITEKQLEEFKQSTIRPGQVIEYLADTGISRLLR